MRFPTRRELFGGAPLRLLPALAPTAIGVCFDQIVRPLSKVAGATTRDPSTDRQLYVCWVVCSALFWFATLWTLARALDGGPARRVIAIAAFAIGVTTLAVLIGAEWHYFRFFNAYFGRDTFAVALAFRESLGVWAREAKGALGVALAFGLVLTACLVDAAMRLTPALRDTRALVPFAAAQIVAMTVIVSVSGYALPAATPPDTSVLLATAAFVRSRFGAGDPLRGLAARAPAPLPKMDAFDGPDVVLIVTEGVRADALSTLDESQIPLGKTTIAAPGTFLSCVNLWTGLPVNSTLRAPYEAPLIWDVAHARGYDTSYFGAQPLDYRGLGEYLASSSLDVLVGAEKLGPISIELGAKDEDALAAAATHLEQTTKPAFEIVHLSNTHYPYRDGPSFVAEGAANDLATLRGRYDRAVAFQLASVRGFLARVQNRPRFARTIVIFVSDHGEQFREHGQMTHLRSFFDEELRVPGFVIAGSDALTDADRSALATWADRRVYLSDVHRTMLELLRVDPTTLPLANATEGRSLLQPATADEPVIALTTAGAVWATERPIFGAMVGEKKVYGGPETPWACVDVARDPLEKNPIAPTLCEPAYAAAKRAYPNVPVP